MLSASEQVLCDKGYKGDLKCCTPFKSKSKYHCKAMSVARARHETVNRCLKRWSSLKQVFRHHREKHHIIFRAVAVLTQLLFDSGYKPFQLVDWDYKDPIFGYEHPSGGPPILNNSRIVPEDELRTYNVRFAPGTQFAAPP